MRNFFAVLANALRPNLPKDHHELALLLVKITFFLWMLMEAVKTLQDKFKDLLGRF